MKLLLGFVASLLFGYVNGQMSQVIGYGTGTTIIIGIAGGAVIGFLAARS